MESTCGNDCFNTSKSNDEANDDQRWLWLLGLQIEVEVIGDLAEKVDAGVASVDAVVAVGVRQFTEILVSLDE